MPPGTSYFYVAYRVAVGNCVWEKLTLSVKAMRLCQLSRGESQRIFSIQQVLTVGYNRLPLWGSWRGAPERVSLAEAGVETALSVKALRLCQLSRGESQRISLIQQVLTVGYNWLPLWGSWRGAPERAEKIYRYNRGYPL